MAGEASEFGRQVRALRHRAGLTQAELAEASGISERTVSDLERGLRATVYPATARRLATALAVGEDDLSDFLLSSARGRRREAETIQVSPSSRVRRSLVPFRLTRLIGREPELTLLLELLDDARVRLVTVVGPGGVGKTRLAAEIYAVIEAQDARDSYFVSLSDVEDASLVMPTVAACVGLQPAPGDLIPLLARRFGQRRALLVLDTFEHLVAAATEVGDLVAACPGLTILVTSRTAMNIRGEHEVLLRPLAVVRGAGTQMTAPATTLFLERAQAVSTALPATAGTFATVTEICVRLDGLPLAIELAAARLKHMPLADLHSNLDRRLDRLVGGPRDVPRRHQTMRAALDWSHALLEEPERRLFHSLSVFRGSVGLDAVAAIVSGEHDAAEDVTASLHALVNASLLQAERGQSGPGRYRLLDLVREYAQERAEAEGDPKALRYRHLRHFVGLAERAEPQLRGPDQREWHARLLDDEANFRAALSFALEVGETELALRLAGALWMFWRWAGLFREGRTWLDAAVAGGAGGSTSARLQALWGAGWLAYHQGDYRRTDQAGREMLEVLDGVDDQLPLRNALTLVGNAALAEGRLTEAIAVLDRALAACERGDSGWHLATSLLNLGTAQLTAGRTGEAKSLLSRALAVYEEVGDRHFTARTLIELGYAEIADEQPIDAAGRIESAMTIAMQLGDGWSIADGIEAAACLCSQTAPATTTLLMGAAERLRDQIAMRPHPPHAAINDAHAKRARSILGAVVFDETWATGRDTPLPTIVEVAVAAASAARYSTGPLPAP